MRQREQDTTTQIDSDGVTVWVVNASGFTIGRFGKLGIDVHSAVGEDCLHCTHEWTTAEDWDEFVRLMALHHGVSVSAVHRPERFA